MGNSPQWNAPRKIGKDVTVLFNYDKNRCNEKNWKQCSLFERSSNALMKNLLNSIAINKDWYVLYTMGKDKIQFSLKLDIFNNNVECRFLRVHFMGKRDELEESFLLSIRMAKYDLLEKLDFDDVRKCTEMIIEKESNDSGGYVAKTIILSHTNGRGIVVVEQRSKQRGMNPYKVSFEHFYEIVRGNKVEVLLAMKLDVFVSNNEFVLLPTGPFLPSYSSNKEVSTSRVESLLQHERSQVPYSSQ